MNCLISSKEHFISSVRIVLDWFYTLYVAKQKGFSLTVHTFCPAFVCRSERESWKSEWSYKLGLRQMLTGLMSRAHWTCKLELSASRHRSFAVKWRGQSVMGSHANGVWQSCDGHIPLSQFIPTACDRTCDLTYDLLQGTYDGMLKSMMLTKGESFPGCYFWNWYKYSKLVGHQ